MATEVKEAKTTALTAQKSANSAANKVDVLEKSVKAAKK